LAGKLLYVSAEKTMISLSNFKYPGDMAVPGNRIGRFERSQGDLMKKLIMTALTGLVLVALATPVLAMGPLDINAGLGLHSKYVWRGMVVTPDMVLQPEVTLGLLGFTAGFWGNIDTNDVNGQDSEFNEIDWTLGYELGLPFMNFARVSSTTRSPAPRTIPRAPPSSI
jgi:hypothetical protein